MKSTMNILLASAGLLLVIGCSENKGTEPAATADPAAPAPAAPATEPAPAAAPAAAPGAQPTAAAGDAAAQAKTLFQTRCVICHGENGKGDGPTAQALNPKPRDYTDAEWQKSVTDEQLAKTIVGGGQAVGKSPLMPANPDLADKPEVVAELVKIIRGFGAQN